MINPSEKNARNQGGQSPVKKGGFNFSKEGENKLMSVVIGEQDKLLIAKIKELVGNQNEESLFTQSLMAFINNFAYQNYSKSLTPSRNNNQKHSINNIDELKTDYEPSPIFNSLNQKNQNLQGTLD